MYENKILKQMIEIIKVVWEQDPKVNILTQWV